MRGIFIYIWFKSIFDRLLAFMALLILSPLLVMIAIAVSIESPGGPFYGQERVGKDGRKFILIKFRSMYLGNDDSRYKKLAREFVEGNKTLDFAVDGKDIFEFIHEGRVTRVGSLLRRSSLDELPQLINVLKGDMSLIGPRPDIPVAVEAYKEHHKLRLSVKQGLTGLWQVSPGRKRISFDDIVKLDSAYIKRQSPLLDAKIVFQTIREMLKPRGL